jgi:hypothetical protein
MSDATTREGGCLCGAVRFRTTGAPIRTGQCHCDDCRKVSGGGPAYLVGFAGAAFEKLQGAPSAYSVTGASGHPVNRWFCSGCGTPLWSVPEVYPDLVYVKVGAFDSYDDFRPDFAVWTDGAPPWHLFPEGVARFAKGRT